MSFTAEQKAALAAPLDSNHVAQRSQSGRQLSYIEGWWAEAEANRIFGFDGWESIVSELRLVSERERKLSSGKDGWSVSYVATVRVRVLMANGEAVTRDGVGAGHGIDADLGLAHESAIKEASTDAEKRALKTFGNPFGLALYDKTQANVVNMAERKSSAQAKRDGDHERIKGMIHDCQDLEQLGFWLAKWDEHTAQLPLSWLDAIHDVYLQHRADLIDKVRLAEPEAA